MTQSPEHNPALPEASRLGYEPQTISIRGLLIFIVLFALSMLALQALLSRYMRAIELHDARQFPPPSVFHSDQQPPPPNLQPSVGHDTFDYQDLERDRRQEDAMFSKLGWEVDAATHRVSIPAQIARQVAQDEQTRAVAPHVPPTTTGKDSNSIVPGPIPPFDTHTGINGGQRP